MSAPSRVSTCLQALRRDSREAGAGVTGRWRTTSITEQPPAIRDSARSPLAHVVNSNEGEASRVIILKFTVTRPIQFSLWYSRPAWQISGKASSVHIRITSDIGVSDIR